MRLMAAAAVAAERAGAAEGAERAGTAEAAVAVAAQPVAAASTHYFNYLFTQRKQTCRRYLSCLVITIVVVAYACGICSS